MRKALIALPLIAIALTIVSASAALLNVGDAIAQAFKRPVASVPAGQCHTLPADTVCIEVPPPEPPTGLSCLINLVAKAAELTWQPGKYADKHTIHHGASTFGPNVLDSVDGSTAQRVRTTCDRRCCSTSSR
jgi:hypothetical protein